MAASRSLTGAQFATRWLDRLLRVADVTTHWAVFLSIVHTVVGDGQVQVTCCWFCCVCAECVCMFVHML